MIINFEHRAGNSALTHIAINKRRCETKTRSDADLIKRIAAGDKFSMRALYGRHNLRVFHFALRILSNESAAEDVVSEVFFDVWRKPDSFDGRSRVSTWLLAIARQKAIEAIRLRPTELLDGESAGKINDPSENSVTATQKKQTSSIIRKCLTQLSPAHREIIDLVYYQGKTIDEVVTIIGIARDTVKTRMFYARRQLADLLRLQSITKVVGSKINYLV
jgi:RNA polymerase sigma-70 factor (ECF subfamily)